MEDELRIGVRKPKDTTKVKRDAYNPSKAVLKNVSEKKVGKIKVTTLDENLGSDDFVVKTLYVYPAVNPNYVQDTFYVLKDPYKVIVKVKGNWADATKQKPDRATMVKIKDFIKQIQTGLDGGIFETADKFKAAGLNVRVKAREVKSDLRKLGAHDKILTEIIDAIIDDKGQLKQNLPWASNPYQEYPTMNFFRLYKAIRRRERETKKTPDKRFTPLMRDMSLRYRGINLLRLKVALDPKIGSTFGSNTSKLPFFITRKQAKSLGGNVLPLALPIHLLFWKPKDDPTMTREERMINGTGYNFTVYRITDIVGDVFQKKIDKVVQTLLGERTTNIRDSDRHNGAEELLEFIKQIDNPPKIEHVSTQTPFYSHMRDTVYLPPREAANTITDYYATLFHELTHWTGNQTRLNRYAHFDSHSDISQKQQYNVEELVAEMGSYLLSSEAGIQSESVSRHAVGYIGGWVRAIQKKPFWLNEAARLASESTEYLLSKFYVKNEDEEQDNGVDVVVDQQDTDEFDRLTDLANELRQFLEEKKYEAEYLDVQEMLDELQWIFERYPPEYLSPMELEFREENSYKIGGWGESDQLRIMQDVESIVENIDERISAIPVPVLSEAYTVDNLAPSTELVAYIAKSNGKRTTLKFDAKSDSYIGGKSKRLGRLSDIVDHYDMDSPIRSAVLGDTFGKGAYGLEMWSTSGVSFMLDCDGEQVCHHLHESRSLENWLRNDFVPEVGMPLCPTCAKKHKM